MPKWTMPDCQTRQTNRGKNEPDHYQVVMITLERQPGATHKEELKKLCDAHKSIKQAYIAEEISPKGYHHTHVAIEFIRRCGDWKALCTKIQKEYGSWKDGKISVHANYMRQGEARDYNDVVKYLKEKRYKGGIEWCDGEGMELKTSLWDLAHKCKAWDLIWQIRKDTFLCLDHDEMMRNRESLVRRYITDWRTKEQAAKMGLTDDADTLKLH